MRLFFKSHPAATMLFFLAVILSSMIIKHPVFLGISLSAAWLCTANFTGRMPIRMTLAFIPMILFAILIEALYTSRGVTPLFTLFNGNQISVESVVYGLILGTVFLTVCLWFSAFNAVVTQDDFIYVLHPVLPAMTLLLTIARNFLGQYTRQSRLIRHARSGLGLSGQSGLIPTVSESGRVFSVLTTWAFEHSIETSDSMRARGYGSGKRTSARKRRLSAADRIFLSVMGVLLAGFIASLFFGASYAVYDPMIILAPWTPLNIAGYLCYALLCYLPLIFDLTGAYLWHRSQSRI